VSKYDYIISGPRIYEDEKKAEVERLKAKGHLLWRCLHEQDSRKQRLAISAVAADWHELMIPRNHGALCGHRLPALKRFVDLHNKIRNKTK